MNENEKTLPTVEKQGMIAGTKTKQGVPFQVITKEPKTTMKTNYAYWLSQKSKGLPEKPLIGRWNPDDEKQFQVYGIDGWEDANFWDYSEPMKDTSGNILKNKNGKPKSKPFFETKYIYELKFVDNVEVSFWDKELKQTVTEELDNFNIVLSKNLSDKIQDQINDKRNGPDSFFVLEYDASKNPADQYKVKYHSEDGIEQ